MSVSVAALALILNASPASIAIAADSAQGEALVQDVSAPAVLPAGRDPVSDTPVFLDLAALQPDNSPAPEGPESGDSEIIVTGREEIEGDPLVELNVKSFETIQAVDEAVVAPIALTYEDIVPEPVRDGLRNFLRNLEEPVIALNFLLQLKPLRALKSVARFAVNSTLGIAGLVDVAKKEPFNLPYTPNGFANTLACYGVEPGPYFFLPLVGPTTLRDLVGVGIDRSTLPLAVGSPLDDPYYAIPASTIDALNDRVEIDDQINQIRENSGDPYAETRDLYLQQRKAEIASICPSDGEVVDETLPPRPGKGRN